MAAGLAAAEVLARAAPRLAELATARLYEEQPALSSLGENGRARTLEDFTHHFRALADLDAARFADHVRYCEGLFTARGFPQAWLTDAWRHMAAIVAAELPPEVARAATAVLARAVSRP